MQRSDRVHYLMNLLILMRRDGVVDPNELALVERVRGEIGASPEETEEAHRRVEEGEQSIVLPRRFSDKVRNLEDLVHLTLVDDRITAAEREIVVQTSLQLGLAQKQVDRITQEARERLKRERDAQLRRPCDRCGASCPMDGRFCPDCGTPLAESPTLEDARLRADFAVPAWGVTVLFPDGQHEATEAALRLLEDEATLREVEQQGVRWHMVSWDEHDLSRAVPALQLLSQWHDRRAYFNGVRRTWHELFGFLSCYERRSRSPEPERYCFLGPDSVLNVFGCLKSRMPWCAGADWCEMGQFEDKTTFLFDRDAIMRLLVAHLFAFRLCPALDRRYLAAAQQEFPERALVVSGGPWDYRAAAPGDKSAIAVVRSRPGPNDSVTLKKVFVSGVEPCSDALAREIVRIALAKTGRGLEHIV